MRSLLIVVLLAAGPAVAAPAIHVNQIAYDARGPKLAVVQTDASLPAGATASVIDGATSKVRATVPLGPDETLPAWAAGHFRAIDFSSLTRAGTYRLRVGTGAAAITSDRFRVDENALAKITVPAIARYFFKQRANKPEEWAADAAVQVGDGSKRVDMRGGWCDASGDVSKYLSHLAYANVMSPQQTPMVTWELADAAERLAATMPGLRDDLRAEALWGADYLARALAPEGAFRMVVFSFFSKKATDRKVVGLLADSKTDDRWQASFRAGGGLAIAALARVSGWKQDGPHFTARDYLDGARRAFAHLRAHNRAYLYDGRENLIDDYAALLAATELAIATGEAGYRDAARARARSLIARLTPAGYFHAGDGPRPFWHAVDAGLPVVALVRYLDQETDQPARAAALAAIKKNLDWQLRVTGAVSNPFGLARQTFLRDGAPGDGFFIPQVNETGWWWQGENARLASLATAAILGGRLVAPAPGGWGVAEPLARFAARQLDWIAGANPYDVSFIHGFGARNPPPHKSSFGHGTEPGGIANGITGRKGAADGSGIDYRPHDDGDDWRWTEQWIPNAGWFLAAMTAVARR